MTKKDISEAISCISDRHIEEVTNYITESEVIEMKKIRSNKKSLVKYAAVAACFIVCVLSVVGFRNSEFFKEPMSMSGGLPDYTSNPRVTSTDTDNDYSSDNSEPSATDIIPTSEKTAGGDVGSEGAAHSLSVAMPTGSGFSEEEIESYIEENRQNILQIIETEYSFAVESVWINKKGYCHASCDNDNKVNLDYITLPILVNGEIYASVTLVKIAEDDIVETINIGGDKWKNYNNVILSKPEDDIVFAFLPNAIGEIMILPDNTAINPVDGQIQNPIATLNPDVNWYNLLKTEYNTISGEELLNAENNVIIL